MDKLKTILCPKSTAEVKIVNKFICIMCLARDNLAEGLELETYPTMPVNIQPLNMHYDYIPDFDEWEPDFDELESSDNKNG